MLARRWALLRSARALLACLIVLLAFAPPASSASSAPFVVVAESVRAPVRAPSAERVEVSRVAPARPTESLRSRPVVSPQSPPVEPRPAVRRLYVELCSLLR